MVQTGAFSKVKESDLKERVKIAFIAATETIGV